MLSSAEAEAKRAQLAARIAAATSGPATSSVSATGTGSPSVSRHPGRPKGSTNRTRETQIASPQGDIGVRNAGGEAGSNSPVPPPRATLNSLIDRVEQLTNEPDADSPSTILQGIGQRFVEARAINKPESWRKLQSDLMGNIHLLCPLVLPLKDMLTACREIEDFMKGSSGQVGKSSEEVIAEFLLGKSPLTSKAAAELPSLNLDLELDTGGNMPEGTSS